MNFVRKYSIMTAATDVVMTVIDAITVSCREYNSMSRLYKLCSTFFAGHGVKRRGVQVGLTGSPFLG